MLAAIRDLGYRPNAAARTLATGRTNALGVISVDNTLYGPSSMLYGLEQAAPPDYLVAIARLDTFDRHLAAPEPSSASSARPSRASSWSRRRRPPSRRCINLKTEIPLVAIKCGTDAPLPSVAIDNAAGAARATQYLLDLGHETVHHLGGPLTWLDAQERAEGWRDTLQGRRSARARPGQRRLVGQVRL